ncbi:MAG TPA: outer membrane lipoprotein carrier protein LolA [Bacteroidia bacterium]|nr:outer membrane lipoprotein carrier protein LolA [Bacteroidia bacterium]
MKYLAFLSVLFFTFYSSDCTAQRDQKADEILNGVSEKFRSLKALKANFKIIVENTKDKSTDTQSGIIVIKGSKYKLTMSDQEIICDGKNVWTYLKDANEVQVNENISDQNNTLSPTNIFTIYEKGFKSKYMGEKNQSGKFIQLVELVPVDTKKSYFKIQLQINKSEKMLVYAKIFDRSGRNIIYNVDRLYQNQDTPDQLFTFNKSAYPGVEVIDLR